MTAETPARACSGRSQGGAARGPVSSHPPAVMRRVASALKRGWRSTAGRPDRPRLAAVIGEVLRRDAGNVRGTRSSMTVVPTTPGRAQMVLPEGMASTTTGGAEGESMNGRAPAPRQGADRPSSLPTRTRRHMHRRFAGALGRCRRSRRGSTGSGRRRSRRPAMARMSGYHHASLDDGRSSSTSPVASTPSGGNHHAAKYTDGDDRRHADAQRDDADHRKPGAFASERPARTRSRPNPRISSIRISSRGRPRASRCTCSPRSGRPSLESPAVWLRPATARAVRSAPPADRHGRGSSSKFVIQPVAEYRRQRASAARGRASPTLRRPRPPARARSPTPRSQFAASAASAFPPARVSE